MSGLPVKTLNPKTLRNPFVEDQGYGFAKEAWKAPEVAATGTQRFNAVGF